MSTQTMVKMPDGTERRLIDLETHQVVACDGCGWPEQEPGSFILADIRIGLAEKYGEGARIAAHLCGRDACQLSAFARHFQAIWPLPEAEAGQ